MEKKFQILTIFISGVIFIYRSLERGIVDGLSFLALGESILIWGFVIPWLKKNQTQLNSIIYVSSIGLGSVMLLLQLLVEQLRSSWGWSVVFVLVGFFFLLTGVFGTIERLYHKKKQ